MRIACKGWFVDGHLLDDSACRPETSSTILLRKYKGLWNKDKSKGILCWKYSQQNLICKNTHSCTIVRWNLRNSRKVNFFISWYFLFPFSSFVVRLDYNLKWTMILCWSAISNCSWKSVFGGVHDNQSFITTAVDLKRALITVRELNVHVSVNAVRAFPKGSSFSQHHN